MPDFPIVDAHVHLYDPGAVPYPWMAGVPALDAPHLVSRFLEETGVAVEAAVFVEVDAAPGAHMDEAHYVHALAAGEPLVRAMIPSLPLEEGLAAVADDMAALAAMPLVRGVRRLLQGHADEPGWALREPFVEAVRTLARRDWSFDLCMRAGQVRGAAALAGACPDVRFVLDHLGKPDVGRGALDPWREDVAALAALPNVWCKVSGVVTEADHARWTPDDLAPFVRHAIDAFGYGRVMFGGDWPVAKLAGGHARWVDALDAITADASPSERRALWRDNAVAFYRLDQPA